MLLAMTLPETLDTMRVHRVAGLTGDRRALVTTRPFHAPHQTISYAGLIDGGHVPLPGEVSRALTACWVWMSCPSTSTTYQRCCARWSRTVSLADNGSDVIGLAALTER
jgi:hypothetical protein